jgi:uncharacterized protein (TIGR02284 family)
MTELHQKVDQLNNLLVINYATERVYLDAFEATTDPELKHFFKARAFQRNEFCRFLAAEIRNLGSTPMLTDVAETNLRQSLPDLSKVLASKNLKVLFVEINKLKLACLMHYNKVLANLDLSHSIVELLERQKQAISTSLSTLAREDRLSVG